MESWPRVALTTPVGSLIGKQLAVGGLGPDGVTTVVYAQVFRNFHKVKVAITDTHSRATVAGAGSPVVAPEMTLGEVVLAHADVRPWSAAHVPGLRWNLPSHPFMEYGWLLLSGLLIALTIVTGQPLFLNLALPSLLGYVTVKLRGRQSRDRKAVNLARVVSDGRTILPGEVWTMLPASDVDPNAESLTPTDRATLVKETYGKLRSDVAYRIENSALFDGAFEPTQRFEIAMLAWDPASPEADALATELERSFDAARSAAEAAGFAHLPATARDTARKAHGASVLAVHTSSPAEREAAAAKAATLLRSLALYYLPTIDPQAPALLATPKQIEPAP